VGNSYNFAIQEMLLDHDCIDCLWVFEGEKAEATRPASGAISHDGAFVNITELGEIIMKGF
jgi:hypothetical protein